MDNENIEDVKNKKISFVFGGRNCTIPSSEITIEKLCQIIISGDTITINNGNPIVVGWEGEKPQKWKTDVIDYSVANTINRIRHYNTTGYKKLASTAKGYLPYVLLSGIFNYRDNKSIIPESYTSIIGIDIDEDENTNVTDWQLLKKTICEDKSIIFCVISPRGKGLKGAMLLDKDDVDKILSSTNYNNQNDLISQCVYPILEKKWNVKLDMSQGKLSQPFFLTSDPNGYVNFNAIPKMFDFDSFKSFKENPKKLQNKKLDIEITYSKGSNNKINNKYLQVIKYIVNNDPYRKKQLNDFFATKTEEYHYNSGLMFVINKLNIDGRKLFYNVFKNYSTSNTIRPFLTSFDTWNSYLDSDWNQVKGKKERTLKSFFKNSGIMELDVNYYDPDKLHDFYGNKYTSTFTAEKYITENSELLKKSLISGINILKSGAGTGKSTFFEDLVMDYIGKNIVIISVKNILLKQQDNHYVFNEQISMNFEIHQNFDYRHTVITKETGNIIFTTINSLYKIIESGIQIDLILFDEAHLLVDYSKIEDDLNVNHKNERYIELYKLLSTKITQVYASATPEKFVNALCNLDFNYINVDVTSCKKIDLNVVYTKNWEHELYDLLLINSGCTNNLIYINNKKEGRKIADFLQQKDEGIKTELLNNNTQKDEAMISIVNDERLKTGVTYISTCYISEGINFLNNEKFNIYYIDNHTTNIDNLYQLTSRFRKKIIESFFLTTRPLEYKSVVDKNDKTKRKREYYNNVEKFDFSKNFQKIYSENKKIQDCLDLNNWNKNYFKCKNLCDDGRIIDRFKISYDVDKEGLKYIKTNYKYYDSMLRYYFNPNYRYCKDEEKMTMNNQKANEIIQKIYEEYEEGLDNVFKNHLKFSEIFEGIIDIEFLEQNENIFRRISRQNQQLKEIKEEYDILNIDVEIDYELIYESPIKFQKELFKLTSRLAIISDKGSIDIKLKEEYNKTLDWLKTILIVKDYVEASALTDYLNKNNIVRGSLWINRITSDMDLKSSRKCVKGKAFRIWKKKNECDKAKDRLKSMKSKKHIGKTDVFDYFK